MKNQEILGLESIVFPDEPDSFVWTLSSNGKYSVQSLYAVVYFRPPCNFGALHSPKVKFSFSC
jgi:hypothetical protein